MPNLKKDSNLGRETQVQKSLSDEGYPVIIKSDGADSPVDFVGIKEMFVDEDYGLCGVLRMIRIKTSKRRKRLAIKETTIETENGSIPVENWIYPEIKNGKSTKKKRKSKK